MGGNSVEQENTNFSSKISEKIWGHRFTENQRGPEYTLEFLNILVGTNFSFEEKYYQRRKMVEFRKFVYEGIKEGAAGHTAEFEDTKKNAIKERLGINEKQLIDLQMFFRNLTVPLLNTDGKTADRSWFAQMLYPLNESLLFSEIRVNRDKGRKKDPSINFERNFFARGGELYYLMIFYGTLENSELRIRIEKNLEKLLTVPSGLSNIITQINETFEEYGSAYKESAAPLFEAAKFEEPFIGKKINEYPVLPSIDLDLYKEFAFELDSLLKINIDVYEMFGILTSLITFQLHRYMIYQAEKIKKETTFYFIDCLEGKNKPIKFLAQESYRNHEYIISEAYNQFVQKRLENVFPDKEAKGKLMQWRTKGIDEKPQYNSFFKDLMVEDYKKTKKERLVEALETHDIDIAIEMLKLRLNNLYMEDLSDTQLPIMKILARDGHFAITGRGIKPRYVLQDSILSALVFTILDGESSMAYDDFLNILYKKFNIVIGEHAAKESGIYAKEGINLTHLRNNEKKMRLNLKQNGLLQEYSDATALIRNPYHH